MMATDVVGAVSAIVLVMTVAVVALRRATRSAAVLRNRALHHQRGEPATTPRPIRTIDRILAVIERRRVVRSLRDVDASVVADLLDRTARHCASGVSLTESFSASVAASPLRRLFAPTSAALEAGETVERALDRQPAAHPHVVLAVHAVRLCARRGGNISESLDRAAATLRERSAASRERHAQSAQARLSARVLTVLPICFGGWTIATTRSVQQFVLTAPGLACIGIGLILNVAGWWSISRVIRRTS